MARTKHSPALSKDVPVAPINAKIDLSVALRLRIQDGLSYEEIGLRFGATESAVRQRLARFLYLCDDPSNLEAYRNQKQAVFETLEHAIITRLWSEVEHGRCSVGDLARALDTVSKHVRLLTGQSTQNIGLLVRTLTDVHKDLDGALAPPCKGESQPVVEAEVADAAASVS